MNAVAPTFIATPGTEGALNDPAFKADVLERIAALHRVGQPMDVAGAIVFLASPAASLITGHTLADRWRLDRAMTTTHASLRRRWRVAQAFRRAVAQALGVL